MQSTRYSSRTLTELESSGQIFEGKKYSDTKFHENPSSGSRVVSRGRTDTTKPTLASAILQRRLNRSQISLHRALRMSVRLIFTGRPVWLLTSPCLYLFETNPSH